MLIPLRSHRSLRATAPRWDGAAPALIHALGRGWAITSQPLISTHFPHNPPFSVQSGGLCPHHPPAPFSSSWKGEERRKPSPGVWVGAGCRVTSQPRRWVRVVAGWVIFPAPGCRNSSSAGSQLQGALFFFARSFAQKKNFGVESVDASGAVWREEELEGGKILG